MPTEQPNILVIMTDQHSKHMLGCYGNDLVRTPNLDRLASEGLTFDSAYCPSPLCVPSRMSFMTSRFPSRNRILHNNSVLSSSIPTWATALTIAGYETALIGRMHFEGFDQQHGFERRVVGEFGAGYPGSDRTGGPGFTVFPGSTTGQNRSAVEIAGRGVGPYQMMDDMVTDRACSYLMRRAESDDGRPFAAVVGYLLPHCPFVGEADLFDYYYDRVDIPEVEEAQPEAVRRFRDARGILDPPLATERIRVARAAYFAMCESVDRMIGRVLEALERSGEADRTMVIYTSDHGEMAGEHGCWWKSNYYEGSVGIPMIARFPHVIARGSRTEGAANLMDLGPTFCDLTGTGPMPLADGTSLAPLLSHPDACDGFEETMSELVDRVGADNPVVSRMIRSGPFKYYHCYDGSTPPVLYHLTEDPSELTDLHDAPEHAGTVARLESRLTDGWNPEAVATIAAEEYAGYLQMREWGQIVQPVSPYRVPMPSPLAEENAERR